MQIRCRPPRICIRQSSNKNLMSSGKNNLNYLRIQCERSLFSQKRISIIKKKHTTSLIMVKFKKFSVLVKIVFFNPSSSLPNMTHVRSLKWVNRQYQRKIAVKDTSLFAVRQKEKQAYLEGEILHRRKTPPGAWI